MKNLSNVRVRCSNPNNPNKDTWRSVSAHVLHENWDPDKELSEKVAKARSKMLGESLSPFVIEAHTLGGKKTKQWSDSITDSASKSLRTLWGWDDSRMLDGCGLLMCKGAAYHNDPFDANVAYANWYVDGPPIIFEVHGKSKIIQTGDWIVFDPYAAHRLYQQNPWRMDTKEVPQMSTFVTMSVPLELVRPWLNIKISDQLIGVDITKGCDINPETGECLMYQPSPLVMYALTIEQEYV